MFLVRDNIASVLRSEEELYQLEMILLLNVMLKYVQLQFVSLEVYCLNKTKLRVWKI